MSVSVLVAVAVVAAVVVLLPVMLFQSLAAALEGGGGSGGRRGRDPRDYQQKTQEDLRERAKRRVADLLDEHGIAYERGRRFETSAGAVTAPFYLPERGVAVILDDWYDDYLLDKHADVATVIVELHVTPEQQLRPLRRALGVDADRGRAAEDRRVDVGEDDAAVLELDDGDVSVEELRSAYRERIKETHPDQNDSEDAEEEFRRVKRAYENLREQVAD